MGPQGFLGLKMAPEGKGAALKEYVRGPLCLGCESSDCLSQSVDLTEMAKEGKLDPVIGREEGECASLNRLERQLNMAQRFGVPSKSSPGGPSQIQSHVHPHLLSYNFNFNTYISSSSLVRLVSERPRFWRVLPAGLLRRRSLRYVHFSFASNTIPTRDQSLHNKRVLAIDLASIMAGSGIRGQFEEKFKALLRDIEEEAGQVICFIDELRA
jgi:hypothetical protein